MSAWVGVAPLIGAGSLDGFAIGALASGACFLAITALRRGRKRYGLALSDGRGPKEGWLCEHVMAAEAFPAYAERLAQPYIPDLEPESEDNRLDAAGPDDGVSGADQFAHADEFAHADQFADADRDGSADRDGEDDPASQGDDGLDWMSPLSQGDQAGQERGWAFLASGYGRAAGSYHSRHRRGAHRPPELAFPDETFGTSRRPDVRRLPRHAAPATGLSSRLSARMSSLMTSLIATRVLTGGAHG